MTDNERRILVKQLKVIAAKILEFSQQIRLKTRKGRILEEKSLFNIVTSYLNDTSISVPPPDTGDNDTTTGDTTTGGTTSGGGLTSTTVPHPPPDDDDDAHVIDPPDVYLPM